jgi:histone deacetylase 6
MNVGWSRKGMGDDEYLAVWEKLLMPVAKEFQPELILVSAGFDAAQNDLGECKVTPECFGRLTRQLMTLTIPIVCSLEGGYVRSILGKCVHHVMASLLNPNSAEESKQEDDEDRRERGELDVLDIIDPIASKDIRATIAAHRAYWNCLRSL